MPAFLVKAYTADGRPVSVNLQAFDAAAAETVARDRALFPTKITQARSVFSDPARVKLSRIELAELFTHLELQVGAGILAVQAIAVLKERLPSKRVRFLLNEVYDHLVSARGNLTSAFARHPRTFPADVITVLKAGEDSGTLEKSFAELRERIEFTSDVRRTINSALQYPLILALMGSGMITFFMSSTVPKFTKVLSELNVELPMITKVVIATGNWFADYWPYIPITLIVSVSTFLLLRRSERFGTRVDGLLLKIPGYGEITRHLSAALFCRIYRSLYLSRFNALDSLDLCATLLPNKELRARLRRARRLVRDGSLLADAFLSSQALPPEACAIVGSGEASGHLDESFLRVAGFYSQVAKHRIKVAADLLGPLLILLLGAVIGTTVIAMLLPILRLASQIR